MRLCLLGDPSGWHLRRLSRAAAAAGHEHAVVPWRAMTAALGGADALAAVAPPERFGPAALADADAVIVRTMPAGSLDEVIVRMDMLGRLAAAGVRVVNPPRALEAAIDKYLSLARLAAAGIPVPRTIVVQHAAALRGAWEALGGDVVSKPLFGSRGRGIERLDSPAHLAAAAERLAAGGIAYLQEFIPHAGWDARILVVGQRVFSMRRVATDDWRLNLARGARPEPFTPPADWVDLARRAAATLGADVAGVDLLPHRGGGAVVVEVNGVPGWRGLQTVCDTDVADAVIAYVAGRAR
ncbi:MAG: RimK family alpha-L-glutamate ligase [Planctomycetaceae bacterium]